MDQGFFFFFFFFFLAVSVLGLGGFVNVRFQTVKKKYFLMIMQFLI